MHFSDLALSKRLERAEGHACVRYAEARRRLFPDSGAEWTECDGAYAVFDGIDSPVTQTFGLAIFEELSPSALDVIERFFLGRGAPVLHEVSPFAGVAALGMLCNRNYRPIEISNVLCQPVERPTAEEQGAVSARVIAPEEALLWSDISARGWSHEHPELRDFFLDLGAISAAREEVCAFLPNMTGNLAPLACCAFMMALLCSAARLRFRSCGIVGSKQRSFTSVCATRLTMDAIWQ
jgi:hypothetical protein